MKTIGAIVVVGCIAMTGFAQGRAAEPDLSTPQLTFERLLEAVETRNLELLQNVLEPNVKKLWDQWVQQTGGSWETILDRLAPIFPPGTQLGPETGRQRFDEQGVETIRFTFPMTVNGRQIQYPIVFANRLGASPPKWQATPPPVVP